MVPVKLPRVAKKKLKIVVMALQCDRCRYKWVSRSAKDPKECPACKSRYWNKARVRKRPKRVK